MARRYDILSHTADTGIVAYGATLAEVFENAAFAMFDLMFDFPTENDSVSVQIEVTAANPEDLLVDWLSTLLYEAESKEVAFRSFEVGVSEEQLWGRAGGLASDRLELIGPPVKAVTYHDLVVEKTTGGWRAQVIFDV
jgi:SHS2 domain-containing protein